MKINLPCKITIARIILIPLVLVFYLIPMFPATKLVATALFVIACCTDFVDGHIARKYNMVTDLGKFLDPIADKLLATVGVLLIVFEPAVFVAPYGLLLAILMISRDTIVNLLRQIAATKNVVIAADKTGKLKTIALNIFIPFFMVLSANIAMPFMNSAFVLAFQIIGYSFAGIFAVLTVVSLVNYIAKNRAVLSSN